MKKKSAEILVALLFLVGGGLAGSAVHIQGYRTRDNYGPARRDETYCVTPL